jgi:hypothetical protein
VDDQIGYQDWDYNPDQELMHVIPQMTDIGHNFPSDHSPSFFRPFLKILLDMLVGKCSIPLNRILQGPNYNPNSYNQKQSSEYIGNYFINKLQNISMRQEQEDQSCDQVIVKQ